MNKKQRVDDGAPNNAEEAAKLRAEYKVEVSTLENQVKQQDLSIINKVRDNII